MPTTSAALSISRRNDRSLEETLTVITRILCSRSPAGRSFFKATTKSGPKSDVRNLACSTSPKPPTISCPPAIVLTLNREIRKDDREAKTEDYIPEPRVIGEP